MTISLSPELEHLIHKKMETGLYLSADEVVGEALRLLEERDQLQVHQFDELRKAIHVGINQADRRELIDGPGVFEKLREKVRANSGRGQGR